jgi:hypothetical protein
LSNSLIGCGEEPPTVKVKANIDSEFKQYVDLFEMEQDVNVNIDIQFNEMYFPTIGKCYYAFYIDGPHESERLNLNVEIDPIFWQEATDTEKEVLIFHELGHCVLNRDHDESIIAEYEIPKSIMYPVIFDSPYKNNRRYYVDELKNQKILFTDYLN